MYLPVATQIPDCPGRIIRKAKSGTTYIYYQYGQRYNPEKRYAIPERVCIGKLTEEGLLLPNENYRKYFPGVNLPGEKPRSLRSSCLRIGSFLLIRKLSEDYGLPRILGDFFTPRDLGLFLDLAAYSLVSEDNAAQHYPDYAYNHPLFTEGMRMYSEINRSTSASSL